MAARTLGPKGGGLRVPHRLEKGTSVSENVGPHIGWEENKTIL